MKRARYSAAILKLRGPLVNATIEIYQVVQKELLPTPEKSHYTYNLRDLGKVHVPAYSFQFYERWVHNIYHQVFDCKNFLGFQYWGVLSPVSNCKEGRAPPELVVLSAWNGLARKTASN